MQYPVIRRISIIEQIYKLATMIKHLKPVFFSIFALPVIFSCNKTNPDVPRSQGYVNVTLEDGSYYFTDDRDKTYYPADVSRIGTYPTEDTENGNRAYVWFNTLSASEREGFDYDIALYGVVDILTKTVEVAETEEDVANVGDDPLELQHIGLSSRWLDIRFVLYTDGDEETVHSMTLLDNRLATPENVPEGYQYLEFRQSGNNKNDRILGAGNVSYDLGAYAPSVTGTKGLYIRINSLSGSVRYERVDYNAQKENSAFSGKSAPSDGFLSIR